MNGTKKKGYFGTPVTFTGFKFFISITNMKHFRLAVVESVHGPLIGLKFVIDEESSPSADNRKLFPEVQ